MFPSSGYYREFICPYYNSGLCDRPYCHFGHVKAQRALNAGSSVSGLFREYIILVVRQSGLLTELLKSVGNRNSKQTLYSI